MAENVPFGAPFLTPKIPPEKVYVGPFFRSFPGSEAYKLFSGGGGCKIGVLGGGQKVYVEKVYVLFPSPTLPQEAQSGTDCKKTGKPEQLRTNRDEPLLATTEIGDCLRSWPPFTGVLLGPGPESAPRSAF